MRRRSCTTTSASSEVAVGESSRTDASLIRIVSMRRPNHQELDYVPFMRALCTCITHNPSPLHTKRHCPVTLKGPRKKDVASEQALQQTSSILLNGKKARIEERTVLNAMKACLFSRCSLANGNDGTV